MNLDKKKTKNEINNLEKLLENNLIKETLKACNI